MADKPTTTPASGDTKPLEAKDSTAAAVAQTPAAAPKPATKAEKAAPADPCMALMTINGKIAPQTMFRPDNQAQRIELDTLGAVRPLSDAEAALFEKLEANTPAVDDSADDDNLG